MSGGLSQFYVREFTHITRVVTRVCSPDSKSGQSPDTRYLRNDGLSLSGPQNERNEECGQLIAAVEAISSTYISSKYHQLQVELSNLFQYNSEWRIQPPSNLLRSQV